jgi:hypothetical protein
LTGEARSATIAISIQGKFLSRIILGALLRPVPFVGEELWSIFQEKKACAKIRSNRFLLQVVSYEDGARNRTERGYLEAREDKGKT